MRNNREKWKFYDHPTKRELSLADIRYWKATMPKLLKVGIEFEFNLPTQKGTCKGDDSRCPCTKMDEGCWKGCANTSVCMATPSPDICKNYVEGTCDPDKCTKCDNYKFECLGITCVDFVSFCFSCDQFSKDCSTCAKRYLPERDPANIRDVLNREFNPSQHYGKVSESGVVQIAQDGSLLGDKGAEVITVGRRIDFWEFYTMSKRILEKVKKYGGYLNDRTGSHMHVLTSYYDNAGTNANEMEKPLPEVVLANFHQLCRRYQNALTWMTIAMDDPNHMTRWEKFRISILGHSPVKKDMKHVVEDICKDAVNHGGREKYGFVNYCSTRFSGNDIDRLHVEFRQPDSTMCPSYYASIACLHYALVIKAVEISRYGLLKVGEEGWLKKAKKMKEVILNGTGDYSDNRLGNTANLLDNRDYFIAESLDLVNQLKNTLMKLGPAYDILIKLAERPVAMRRVDGDSWEAIEKDLSVEMTTIDQLELELSEIVDLRLIDECASMEEWISEAQKCLAENTSVEKEISRLDIESFVTGKMREGEMIWSDTAGCMISI